MSSSRALITLPSPIREDEIEWKKSIPSGVRFRPSHKDLFHYLHMKVHTGRIDFGGVIRSIDLYSYKPEDLEDLAFDYGDDGLRYFFTPLKRKFAKGTKINRVIGTGDGFWRVTQKSEEIKGDDDKPIMTKTPLCYFEGRKKRKTQWLMDQYMLINEHNNPVMLENWVLCVVHYKPRGTNDRNNGTSTDSRVIGISSQNSTIGPSSSSNPQGPSLHPDSIPLQTPAIPKKRQQCSTSYHEPLDITCPTTNRLSHAQIPKRRSPIANDTPNFDQNQAIYPSLDQIMMSNVLNQDSEEHLVLETLDIDWKDDIFYDLHPTDELNPQNSYPDMMNSTTSGSHPTVSTSVPSPPKFNYHPDANATRR